MLLLVFLLACHRGDDDRVSVLLVTLDTTRADHLGPYGYVAATTPTWDALAAEGTVFERAYSTCPLTIPSHSTMLTGRAPPSHGVRDNGDFLLGQDQVLLSERLSEAGWHTAAFTASFPTQRRWGFDQGFDIYHDPLEGLPTELDWSDERRADEVIDDALETLSDLEGPVFAWVHLFDAHWPYDPPEPFASAHEGRPYDGEIAFADAEAARLIELWDARFPRSLVLVTADHGEGLGDGGETTHGFLLHDGTMHVPLIARGEGFQAGARVSDPVSHVDLVPTVLDVLGLPHHEGLQGRDLREGGSERAYSEALTGQFNLGLAPLYAYTDADGRYMEGAWGAWYPAVDDTVRYVPEGDKEGARETLAMMRGQLDEVIAPTASLDAEAFEQLAALGYLGGDTQAEAGDIDPRDVIDVVPLTWHARQALGMGRFELVAQMITELSARMPGTFGVELLEAQAARARGDLDGAAERYAGLYLRSPSSTVALQLASLEATRGDWAEAEDWYAEALRLQPASPEAMGGLVRSAKAMGELALAQDRAERFLLSYPDHAELWLVRAEMLLVDHRVDEALLDAREGLRVLPGSPWAHTVTGQALWELGRADEAIERLAEAVRIDPLNVPVRLRLTECLLEVGRNAEAVRAVGPAWRLLPGDEQVAAAWEAATAALEAERRR